MIRQVIELAIRMAYTGLSKTMKMVSPQLWHIQPRASMPHETASTPGATSRLHDVAPSAIITRHHPRVHERLMQSKLDRLLPLAATTGLVGAALFIYGVILDDWWLRVLTKPFPVLAMVVLVAARGRGRYARAVLVGLVLCVFGDIFLELGPSTFLVGMIAFLLGHVGYITAFLRRARTPRALQAVPFVCWIGWAASVLWPHLGPMRVPVIAYTSVILVMLWRAAAMLASETRPTPWDWAALVGAVLFAFSDTLIALDRFHAPIDGVRVPIIATYWLGQLLLAASTTSANAAS